MLSTYMGHADISSTHYYIPFAKEVAEEASALFHSRFGTAVTCQISDAQGVDTAESETGGVVSEDAF
jgi:hypothetical protein